MLEPTDRLKVISRVKAIVVKRHFNIGNVNYVDWCRAVDERTPTLLTADDNTFDEGVRTLLCQLKSSHTNFYSSDTNPTMPQLTLEQAWGLVDNSSDNRITPLSEKNLHSMKFNLLQINAQSLSEDKSQPT